MTEIIIGDLTNREHTNAIIKLSITHNFYIDPIWNMVLRKFSPPLLRQLRNAGWSQERIEYEEANQFRKYDYYNWECRLLKKEGVIIGFTFWDYPKRPKDEGLGCCLEFLLVDEAHRGNKYGKLLMDDFIVWADANKPKIKIQFPKADRLLIKFYTKYGFKFDIVENEKDRDPNAEQGGLVEWYRIKN